MCIVGAHLPKFLEDPCLILRGDPDAGVTDRNLHRTISLPGVNSDPSSLRRELHGIGKKVEKYLLDLALIADKVAKALVNCNVKVDAVLGGSLPHKGARVVDGQWQIERCQLKLHATRFHLGEIENLIDEGQQVAARGEDIVGVLGLFLV